MWSKVRRGFAWLKPADSPTPAHYGYDDYGAFNCSGEQMPWHEDAGRAADFIEQSVKQKKPLFWKTEAAWPIPKARPDHWVAWAMVRDQSKLVASRDLSHTELYEIGADVAESNNVGPAKPEVTAAMLGALKEWQATLPAKPTGTVFSKLPETSSESGSATRPEKRRKSEE